MNPPANQVIDSKEKREPAERYIGIPDSKCPILGMQPVPSDQEEA
jgi:hypothetical protein